ncbi:MAG: type IV pilus twitching motility protein PilT [Arenicella sp.]
MSNADLVTNDPRNFLSVVIAGAVKFKASDIHIRTDNPVMLRIDGVIRSLKGAPTLSSDQIEVLINELLDEYHQKIYTRESQADVSFGDNDGNRVRVNIFRAMNKPAIVMRVIASDIPTAEQLDLPPQVASVADLKQGLVIFTGATGSGKSTSMAALLNQINKTRKEHILTIEDPVEYLFTEDKCVISQRQVGIDVPDFALAMKAALREDPDIILMGEMRDQESIEIALNAAETGHLVFSTLHAPTASDAVTRLVSTFTGEAQQTIRAKLAQNMRVVISQRLLPRKGGGRIAGCEVMNVNSRVRELILDPLKIKDIADLVKSGETIEGMLDFDAHLLQLVEKDIITHEDALKNATSPTDLSLKLKGF